MCPNVKDSKAGDEEGASEQMQASSAGTSRTARTIPVTKSAAAEKRREREEEKRRTAEREAEAAERKRRQQAEARAQRASVNLRGEWHTHCVGWAGPGCLGWLGWMGME